ncbi:Chondroitin proteoglycan 4 [Toxocara canis]|uniref:Chondroitin proteoglycan 4 n=1 Tax=Toxocara canis TaxID=6265 RepID=A0A0B2W1N1_TOXCA|nr:Chondroitin proteoglycan 4 [Toxocara canis]
MATTILLYVSLLITGVCASLSTSHHRAISNEPKKQPKTLQADYTALINAAGVPECLCPCIKDLIHMNAVAFDCRDLLDDTANVCSAYSNATACVRKNGCKETEAFEIATKGIYTVCVEKLPLLHMVAPCLKKHCGKALSECDALCGTTKEIHVLTTRTEVKKIAAEGGSLIALLEYLGPLCESQICFLSCAHKSLESRCPATGSGLVDSAVRPFEAIARYLQTVSKTTANDVDKRMPDECAPLINMHYLGRLKFFGALPDRKTVGTGIMAIMENMDSHPKI